MQTTADEITVPDDVMGEPAWEWVNGRARQKLSPLFPHSLMQSAFSDTLKAWAGKRGFALTEQRYRLTPIGEPTRPLVPDVSYIPRERYLASEDRMAPTLPPDIVVDVRSPGDSRKFIDEKTRVYLAAGVKLVLNVDPRTRRIDAHEGGIQRSGSFASYTSTTFPDLTFDLAGMFAELDVVDEPRP